MASKRALRPTIGFFSHINTYPSTFSVTLSSPFKSTPFSTSSQLLKRHTYPGARKTRDSNRHRGESTLRRTGTRWRLSVSDEPLPKPVAPEELPKPETDPDHGLWEFFYDKTRLVNTPAQDSEHGRAWTVEELRYKSWDDLHKLWWVCVKERNRIATAALERETSKLGFGDAEAKARDQVVRKTMGAIRHTLTERYYLWEDALKLAKADPEVDLSGNGSTYTPMEYLEEEERTSGSLSEAARPSTKSAAPQG
ncbi:hypothetical protein VTK73DRAFT_8335 [Phialemonium thermophilum]|uniref:Large ribosomal subunit protein uL29m n=1 Tax=Phialemonium thermophilum TaxID=223376 RepID=A0ABR3Y6X8_9PEZI